MTLLKTLAVALTAFAVIASPALAKQGGNGNSSGGKSKSSGPSKSGSASKYQNPKRHFTQKHDGKNKYPKQHLAKHSYKKDHVAKYHYPKYHTLKYWPKQHYTYHKDTSGRYYQPSKKCWNDGYGKWYCGSLPFRYVSGEWYYGNYKFYRTSTGYTCDAPEPPTCDTCKVVYKPAPKPVCQTCTPPAPEPEPCTTCTPPEPEPEPEVEPCKTCAPPAPAPKCKTCK